MKKITLIKGVLLLFALLTGGSVMSQTAWTTVVSNDFAKFPTGFTNKGTWSNQTYGANGTTADKCGYAKVLNGGDYVALKVKLSKNKLYRYSYKLKKSENRNLIVRFACGLSGADLKVASGDFLLPKVAAATVMEEYTSSEVQVQADGDFLLGVQVVEVATGDIKLRIDDFKLESMDIPEGPYLISTPLTVDMYKLQFMESKTKRVRVEGYNLTGDLNVVLTGTAFTTTIENNVISKDAVQAEGGYTFDVTFNPIAVAPYAETITITGGGLAAPVVINLIGEGVQLIAATLAELGVMDADDITEYTFSGTAVVTLASKDRNVKYIQDGTGAIIIDDAGGLIKGSYATGDEISEIKGRLNATNGMLQFVATTDATKGASGKTIEPTVIDLDKLVTGDQAKLVKVKAVQLVSKGASFIKGTSVTIEGSDIVVRPQYSDLSGLIGKPVPTNNLQDVTGVVLVFNDAIQIVPRSIADIVDSELVGLTDQSADGVTIYANNGVIYVNATAGQTIDIFNTVGQKLNSVVAVEGLNTISYDTAGVVIIKVGATVVKVQM